MICVRLLPILLAALIVAPASAQQQRFSSLEGIVFKIGTREPIRKATVTLNETGGTALRHAYSTTTGTDGKFIFPEVQPGDYRLAATREGYLHSEYGQRKPNGPGVPVQVGGGRQIKDVELPMVATGVIYGHVADRDGDPVVNISVQAFKRTYQGGRREWAAVASAQTNDLGEYRLFEMPPGQYYVGVVPESSSVMARSPIVAGRLTNRVMPAPPNPQERYLPVYFPNSEDVQTASTIDLTSGANVGGVDMTLTRVPTRRVRGSVFDGRTGQPMAIDIVLVPRNSNTSISAIKNASLPTGAFSIESVLPGSYYLVAGEETNNGILSGGVPIEVGAADIENISVPVARGPDFLGRAWIDGRSSNNPDIRHLRINLVPDLSMPGLDLTSLIVEPVSDGSFKMAGVPFGDYRVAVSRLPENTYVKSIRLDGTDALVNAFHVDGRSRAIEVVLGTNPGSLGGIVVSANGEPVSNVTVVLVPIESYRHRADLYQGSSTSESGRFLFRDIPPGDYEVLVWEDLQDGSWQDPDFVQKYADRGRAVHIDEGTNENMELRMNPSGR